MLIPVLKCIHLLLTLGLLGSTIFCLILASSSNYPERCHFITHLNRIILWLLVFALITGTLLVYPKHYTFHTPWIQAAYILVFLSGILVSMFIIFRKKLHARCWQNVGYFLLLIILMGIVHDAVTKTTFDKIKTINRFLAN